MTRDEPTVTGKLLPGRYIIAAMWLRILMVGLGGFIGANVRYWAGYWIGAHQFPWATFVVNMLGCFGLAAFSTLILERTSVSDQTRLLIATGFFGAFTTFSTFNMEALNLMLDGKVILAGGYLAASTGIGLLAGLLGIGLVRWF